MRLAAFGPPVTTRRMNTPRSTVPLAAVCFAVAVLATGCSSRTDDRARDNRRADFEAKRATHVVVTISANDRVRVDNERCSPKELTGILKIKGRVHPGRPVLLLVQSETKADAVAFVRKHAAEAGLGPVELMVAE